MSSDDQPVSAPFLSSLGSVSEDDSVFVPEVGRPAQRIVRRICGALRVTTSILSAVALHPGGKDEQGVAEASRILTGRAALLAQAGLEMAQARAGDDDLAGARAYIKQQAADLVAAQWRIEHAGAGQSLAVDQVIDMFRTVVDRTVNDTQGDELEASFSLDAVTARRLALLSVIPPIFEAINRFDYFNDPVRLVSNGTNTVIHASREALEQLLPGSVSDEKLKTALDQVLVRRVGALYVANWDACARRQVMELSSLPETQQFLVIEEARREGGMSVDHVEEAFNRLVSQMLEMVCEAVPEEFLRPKAEPTPVDVGSSAHDVDHDDGIDAEASLLDFVIIPNNEQD